MIRRLNITYLVIDSFYVFRSLFYLNHSVINVDNYNQILANKIAKSKQQKTQADLEGIFNTFIKNKDYNINYIILNEELNYNPKLRYKNDPHLNEYGNLEFAKNINEILIRKKIILDSELDYVYKEELIDNFYKLNPK